MSPVTLKNGDTFPTIIRGVWQLSRGHQEIAAGTSLTAAIEDAIEQGFNTFDCPPVSTSERRAFRKSRRSQA